MNQEEVKVKTLVIIGAARKNGHTRQMVDLFLEHLDGEKEIIDAYRTEVKPCVDCRFCWKKKECAIKDGMQEIYQKLEEADNIILASPMYFHSITGRMKSLIDRFQVYWAGHVRNDMPETFLRKGAILMVGGAPSFENQFLGGEIVLKNLLNDLSTECLGQVCLPNSDRDSLETRPDIAAQVIALAEKMNRAVK
nr:flavodoxin family protein [Enterocloster citroniae]